MDNKFVQLLKSRKFWASVLALVYLNVSIFAPQVLDKLPAEDQALAIIMQVIGSIATIISFIIGTAIEDAGRAQ